MSLGLARGEERKWGGHWAVERQGNHAVSRGSIFTPARTIPARM